MNTDELQHCTDCTEVSTPLLQPLCTATGGQATVCRLQVGLLGSARGLQKDLERIAGRADTNTPDGLHFVLQGKLLHWHLHSMCLCCICTHALAAATLLSGCWCLPCGRLDPFCLHSLTSDGVCCIPSCIIAVHHPHMASTSSLFCHLNVLLLQRQYCPSCETLITAYMVTAALRIHEVWMGQKMLSMR